MTTMQTIASRAGRQLIRFCADEGGATAIEYAMIAAGVGACVAGVVMNMGSSLKTTFYDKLASLLQ
jgi:pilus assembly protein Flp/PilA